MSVHRVIYGSRAVTAFDPDDLLALLETARRRNAALDVTGMLLYSSGSFLQALEGEADAVHEVYTRIVADPRHTALRILADTRVAGRRCAGWSMGFELVDGAELATRLPGYAPAGGYPFLNPAFVVDGAVAEELLAVYADPGGV